MHGCLLRLRGLYTRNAIRGFRGCVFEHFVVVSLDQLGRCFNDSIRTVVIGDIVAAVSLLGAVILFNLKEND